MIGILCDEHKESTYSGRLNGILNRIRENSNEDIVTFKLSKIDFKMGEIEGNQITGQSTKKIRTSLPKVIFNFSLQLTPENIKRLRYLTKIDGITIVNNTNRFDQWAVMGMLSSSETTNNYILPYHIYNKKIKDYIPKDTQDYLAMPSRGASLPRVIYAKQSCGTDNIEGSQYFRKGHICDYIDASVCQKRWIFIEIPDILTLANLPAAERCYMQRGKDGIWNISGKSSYPKENMNMSKYDEKIDTASLNIAECINKFMPDVGHCFIDYIFDINGNPYFLHFGGFDKRILFRRQDKKFYEKFFQNIRDYSRFLTVH